MAAAQEAVDLDRELAALNRDAYLPDIAGSVNNLANRLAESGHRAEALTAAQEAAHLYAQARQIDGAVYDDDVSRTQRLVAGLSTTVPESNAPPGATTVDSDDQVRPSDP